MKKQFRRNRTGAVCCALLAGASLLLPACGHSAGKAADTGAENNQENILTASQAYAEAFGPDAAVVPREPLTAEAIPEGTVTIRMVGDILLHDRVEEAACDENGSYDFNFIFDQTRGLISSADLAIVNQEIILGGEDLGISGYPSFNAPYEVGDALADTGFDVVLHATNHALDRGAKGVSNALSYWKESHPEMIIAGINESAAEQDTLRITEVNGIRIAVLNYTFSTNGISMPSDMPWAVNMMDEDKVVGDLQRAEQEADFTVVCPHWGTEYSLTVSGYQEKWADIFRENGADLVLGAHPHVIEPIEWFDDENTAENTNNKGGGDMLVYYSLGNFVNWTVGEGSKVLPRMVGGMADVTISRGEDGAAAIRDFRIIPLVCHVTSGPEGVTVYPLSEYTEALAESNEIKKQCSSFSLDGCKDLCREVWGEYYTP